MNDFKNIESKIIKKEEFKEIINAIVDSFNKSEIKLLEHNNKYDELYYELKSYRSNVTEGNTTTIGEFTKIVLGKEDEIYNQTQDNINEVINLTKAYKFMINKDFNEKNLLRINGMLGTDILKNNLMFYRGKYKPLNNHVTFRNNGEVYIKTFRDYKGVKDDVNNLYDMINDYNPKTEAEIFALSLILHTELISIHPFVDGNGRTARVISENFLESYGYRPYTPYSEGEKKEYQQTMGNYSIYSNDDIVAGYKYLSDYILKNYNKNVEDFDISYEKIKKQTQKIAIKPKI